MSLPTIFLDNHSTTRVDPRVVEAMLPTFDVQYANAGSISHLPGLQARELVDHAQASIASSIGCSAGEVVFTSGATESNNLALAGFCNRLAKPGTIVSSRIEHPAILDPLKKLGKKGFRIELLQVTAADQQDCGTVELAELAHYLEQGDVCLVSIMLANNEIGTIQPLRTICDVCHDRGVLVHSDATQAVGKIPVDVEELGVDLMSFSAHKIYGPKGMGALYVRQKDRRVRLQSLIDGGGQQAGRRSGTLNVTGIVGLAKALAICDEKRSVESLRIETLRNSLFEKLSASIPGLQLNGPALDSRYRLQGNLNCQIEGVEGESLMLEMPEIAVASGSTCSAANPEPSHVLRAIGLDDDQIRSSLRFGLGRFNTAEEIDRAGDVIAETVSRMRKMR